MIYDCVNVNAKYALLGPHGTLLQKDKACKATAKAASHMSKYYLQSCYLEVKLLPLQKIVQEGAESQKRCSKLLCY